jgi:carbonic anhydrase/acetyltransferase-like protein (isoleucine patch superfamily)
VASDKTLKFRLLKDHSKSVDGTVLYRIQALRSFGHTHPLGTIKAGTIGGYVASEGNLSHDGDCWIADNALAFGQTSVTGNARLLQQAEIWKDARLSGDAVVSGTARIKGSSEVSQHAKVSGNSVVSGNSRIDEFADVSGDATVASSVVTGKAVVKDRARLIAATLRDDAEVSGTAVVLRVVLADAARLSGNAVVQSDAGASKTAANVKPHKPRAEAKPERILQ